MTRDETLELLRVAERTGMFTRAGRWPADPEGWAELIRQWCDDLDADMPHSFAAKTLGEIRAGQAGTFLEPGLLNAPWRRVRADDMERERSNLILTGGRDAAKLAADAHEGASAVRAALGWPQEPGMARECSHCGAKPLRPCVLPGTDQELRARVHPNR